MKHKSEVFEIFKVFKAMVENSFRKMVKSIRIDNEGEYIKIYFNNIVNLRGFKWNT